MIKKRVVIGTVGITLMMLIAWTQFTKLQATMFNYIDPTYTIKYDESTGIHTVDLEVKENPDLTEKVEEVRKRVLTQELLFDS